MGVELVAEIGSNWNGKLETAEWLIREAASAGADTVKFQHYPDERYGPHVLDPDTLIDLNECAMSQGLGFLCSVFDHRTLREYVDAIGPSRVKIASPELTHHDLLRACVDSGLEIILSTGMSTTTEILAAIEVIYTQGRDTRLMLLHCVSSYPAPPAEMNMLAMQTLGSLTTYGLSDHSLDPVTAPVMAVALGACMIEKHFTLNPFDDGPDHSYALSPPMFRQMVMAVRTAELMRGNGRKRVEPSEDPTARRTAEWLS